MEKFIGNSEDRLSELRKIKKIMKAVLTGDKKVAKETFDSNVSIIDRIADKKIVHKNKAARHKSRLNAAIKSL